MNDQAYIEAIEERKKRGTNSKENGVEEWSKEE
jgi:hypothetical protein